MGKAWSVFCKIWVNLAFVPGLYSKIVPRRGVFLRCGKNPLELIFEKRSLLRNILAGETHGYAFAPLSLCTLHSRL